MSIYLVSTSKLLDLAKSGPSGPDYQYDTDRSYMTSTVLFRKIIQFTLSTMKVTRKLVILILIGLLGYIVIVSVLRLNSKQTSTSSFEREESVQLPSITICLRDGHKWENKTIEDIQQDNNELGKRFKARVITSRDFKTSL